MIEIEHLSKHYGKIKAVDDISLKIGKGEIVGFLGPNGAGKTTTMNILTGYLSSTEGRVRVCGYDVMDRPLEVKRRIGYLPETPPIYRDMTVEDYLRFVSELKKVPRNKARAQIGDIMELVRITDHRKRLINNLSKGYRQRVGLAQSLVGNPEVLVLDEPTVGMDPIQIIEIRKLIRELGKDRTIILSTHILPEVSAVCERIIIIHKGRIAAEDKPANLSGGYRGAGRFVARIEGPAESVLRTVKSVGGVKSAEPTPAGAVGAGGDGDARDYALETEKDPDVRRRMFYALAKEGHPILELRVVDLSLEEIFLQLTTKETLGKEAV
ncbi:MAG: ABC transporter ATP-binding protein [Oscillospiraceae bacterium]|nr:ABC transporter ATP-binding protein [Oscillospiraceae bacterium]